MIAWLQGRLATLRSWLFHHESHQRLRALEREILDEENLSAPRRYPSIFEGKARGLFTEVKRLRLALLDVHAELDYQMQQVEKLRSALQRLYDAEVNNVDPSETWAAVANTLRVLRETENQDDN